jgi:hypothetical protein
VKRRICEQSIELSCQLRHGRITSCLLWIFLCIAIIRTPGISNSELVETKHIQNSNLSYSTTKPNQITKSIRSVLLTVQESDSNKQLPASLH